MRTRIALLCAAVLLLCLSGCTLAGVDAENIMQPPKATGEQAGIQAALEKTAVGKVTFKYPKSGEYRSAIIMHDVDGDKEEEAIAFYRPQGENAGAHMTVMGKKDGVWDVLRDFNGPGTDIDRVDFGDFNGDGVEEVVVGWMLLTTRDKSCSIYQYDKGVFSELLENSLYTEMAVFDIDLDEKDELLSVYSTGQASVAKLLAMSNSTLETAGEVRLDPAIAAHPHVQTAFLDPATPALVLDGYVSSDLLATEVVYWDGKKLIAPFNETSTGEVKLKRNVSLFPRDVDADGYIDFPTQVVLPGEEVLIKHLSDDTALPVCVNWNSFRREDDSFSSVSRTIIGPTEEVWLVLDPLEVEFMTALQDIKQKKVTYYLWSEKAKALSVPLFEVRVFTQYEWQNAEEASEYIIKEEKTGYVYAIRYYVQDVLDVSMQERILNALVIS